jgi:hypothetical protein
MGYFCSNCVAMRDGDPLWGHVRYSKTGKAYSTRCPKCTGKPSKEETGMSMSKKHYAAIAEAIATTVLDPDERAALADRLADVFKEDNALFNPILFRNAADAVLIKEE